MTVTPQRPARPPVTADRHKRAFLVRLTAIASGGMFIDGYILGGIGTVNAAIARDMGLSAAWQGLVAAAALIGIFFGGPLGGHLADRFGRKLMFTLDMAVFVLTSVAQFFVEDPWHLFVVRLLMGSPSAPSTRSAGRCWPSSPPPGCAASCSPYRKSPGTAATSRPTRSATVSARRSTSTGASSSAPA